MINALLILAALLSAGVVFRSEQLGSKGLLYVAKPLTVISIGLIAVLAWPIVHPVYRQLIVLGLAASLVGDVFLMLPKDRFLPGLVAFLLAHLFYVTAFATRLEGFSVLAFLPYVVALLFVTKLLWPHLGRLKIPVIIYSATIAAMAGTAFGVAMEVGTLTAWCGAAGGALFVISDAALAFNRFIGRFGGAQYVILGTYFIAQTLIALSVIP